MISRQPPTDLRVEVGMGDLIAFKGAVSVPVSHCSNCFSDKPTDGYPLSAGSRQLNTQVSLQLAMPLCEECRKFEMATANYEGYARKYDPAFRHGRETLQLVAGFASLVALGGLVYLIYQGDGSITLYQVLAFVLVVALFLVSWLAGRNQWNKELEQQVREEASRKFRRVELAVGPTGASLKLFDDQYAELVRTANPGCTSALDMVDPENRDKLRKKLGI
jgi:hypothetical protein